jgi:error-prone DNA polymerase
MVLGTGVGLSLAVDPFVHLHVHSNFSFLDGASPPDRLLEQAAELGMTALALTDHHGLYGAVRFMHAASAYGMQPIVGIEIEVARDPSPRRHHLVLLARDRTGYSSLCRIITKAQLAYQDDPHIGMHDLAALAQNIVVLLHGTHGPIAATLPGTGTNLDPAIRNVWEYIDLFGRENLWIELHHHLLAGDDRRNQQLLAVARQTELPWVITNNVHYARREEYRLRDVMACIQTNTTLDQWTDIRHRNAEYYLKTSGQLRQAMASLPLDALEKGLRASAEIATQCNLTGGSAVLATTTRAPAYPVPTGETPFSFLHGLCNDGLRRRYRPLSPEAVNRLAYELNVVEQMDLSEFFLCVWDMVQFSRQQGIRCAGRGSAADSIIAYVLDITTVDPLANNLLFDRFLNPGRVGMPDVDIDFDSRRRAEVIEYVENKYGPEHSAMVANLITYRARSAFRDVAKTMGYAPGLVDHIASSLSYRSVNRIREDLQAAGILVDQDKTNPGTGISVDRDELVSDAGTNDHALTTTRGQPATTTYGQLDIILALCEQLDGYPRHLSLHNGGMLITREPLVDVVPIEYATSGVRVCQFNKDDVEALGLIKFDILGLRTLSIVDESVATIKAVEGIDLAIDDLPLDDTAVYDLICTSKTIGVFQIESPGQWNLLQRAQPRTFGDLIVQIALFRPGPLQGGMVDPYIERRCGRQAVTYMHPSLEPALADTLGVVIFQEQVLQVAHDFAGLSYSEADGLRRAISHYRTHAEMDVCRTAFIESAVGLGRDRALSEEMYKKLTYFSGYGFCRSHAAAFAKTVYQTAFLKTYFPAEFLAAILSNEPCCYYPTQTVIEEARKWGIHVLPVDVNRSHARYWVETVGTKLPAIRMGFLQVKGVSEGAATAIVEARERGAFQGLVDFWRRTSIERDAVQNLIAVGSFDSLGVSRRKLLWQLEEVIRNTPRFSRASHVLGSPDTLVMLRQPKRQGAQRQLLGPPRLQTMFDLPLESVAADALPDLPALTELDLAGLDMTIQNASATYSVMMFYRRSLKAAGIMSIGEVQTKPNGLLLKTAGIVISRQQPPTAKGMTFLVLSDEEGELPAAIPPQLYEQCRRTLSASASLVVEGVLQRHRRYVSVMIRRIWNMRDIATLDAVPYTPQITTDRTANIA